MSQQDNTVVKKELSNPMSMFLRTALSVILASAFVGLMDPRLDLADQISWFFRESYKHPYDQTAYLLALMAGLASTCFPSKDSNKVTFIATGIGALLTLPIGAFAMDPESAGSLIAEAVNEGFILKLLAGATISWFTMGLFVNFLPKALRAANAA